MSIGREFYQLLRLYGGIALEHIELIETDFAAAAGAAYTPPEEGDRRRIDVSRTIQLLAQCPVIVQTYQTSAATIRFPASTASEDTNDSGGGRYFLIKNSGAGNLFVQDYLGAALRTIKPGHLVTVHSVGTNQWLFHYTHNLDALPAPFRDNNLEQILDDLSEEDTGLGFTELTYSGVFVTGVTVWQDNLKLLKRTETTITYSPSPFVSQVVKQVFGDDGVTVVSTITAVVTYNVGIKSVKDIDITVTRP
jgi:hypothetical protein